MIGVDGGERARGGCCVVEREAESSSVRVKKLGQRRGRHLGVSFSKGIPFACVRGLDKARDVRRQVIQRVNTSICYGWNVDLMEVRFSILS